MKQPSLREYVAEGAILLAAVVGAWFFFVEGRNRSFVELEARAASASVAPTRSAQSLEQLAQDAAGSKEQVAAIRARQDGMLTASRVYEVIKQLAEECSAEILHLEPGGDAVEGQEGLFFTTRLSLSVEADYAGVCDFADRLQVLTFLRPVSVIVTPVAGQEGRTAMRIECEIVRFSLPHELAESHETGGS